MIQVYFQFICNKTVDNLKSFPIDPDEVIWSERFKACFVVKGWLSEKEAISGMKLQYLKGLNRGLILIQRKIQLKSVISKHKSWQ